MLAVAVSDIETLHRKACPCHVGGVCSLSALGAPCAVDDDPLSCSAVSGSPVSSSPEFSPESASSAPESGVTRTGSPEAVMRKRVLLRSGMRCTVPPSHEIAKIYISNLLIKRQMLRFLMYKFEIRVTGDTLQSFQRDLRRGRLETLLEFFNTYFTGDDDDVANLNLEEWKSLTWTLEDSVDAVRDILRT